VGSQECRSRIPTRYSSNRQFLNDFESKF